MQSTRCGDIDLTYLDTGEPDGVDDAPVLLLVHGFPLSHAMWRSQVESLRTVCRVVVPDLRGYGESPLGEWPVEGETPSLACYVNDLVAMLDSLGITQPVVFAGFSMGGYIAWPFIEQFRERIAKLVLIDTRAAADDATGRAMRLKMAEKIGEWGAPMVAGQMSKKLFSPTASADVVNETVAAISSTDPPTIAASQLAMAARPDSTPLLPSIDVPTLLIVGEEDVLSTPEEMRGMAEIIPGSELVVIPSAGHMSPVEQPEAVNAALHTFLQK